MNTLISLLIIIVLVFAASSPRVSGQSGRTPREKPNRKPPAPAKPFPFPEPGQTRPGGGRNETIRIDTDLVSVVTSITAPAGAMPDDLQQEDFEVYEDGKPQEIVNFMREQDTPLRLVLLFDSSLSVARRIGFERYAAARFFGRVLRPQDEAALFSFSTEVEILQDLTSRVSRLTEATKRLRPGGSTSLYDAVYLAAEYLRLYPGRHIIVIVSDGGDTTSGKNLQQALAQAQLANAVIYALFSGDPNPSENLRDLAAERALIALTEETGGEVYTPHSTLNTANKESDLQDANYLDDAFATLANRLHTQYTLGFYSNNEARDGRFRKLTVRVRKQGYQAFARSGYYAPKN